MSDRYAELKKRLVDTVLLGPARTSPALRSAVAGGREVPPDLAEYVRKVREHAYRVTDEDVAALKRAGFDDDQLFEITVSAALGAALERLDAGLRAAGGDDEDP